MAKLMGCVRTRTKVAIYNISKENKKGKTRTAWCVTNIPRNTSFEEGFGKGAAHATGYFYIVFLRIDYIRRIRIFQKERKERNMSKEKIQNFENAVKEMAKPFQHLFQGPVADYWKSKGEVIIPIVGSNTDKLPHMGQIVVDVTKEDAEFMLNNLSGDQRIAPSQMQIMEHLEEQKSHWLQNTGDSVRINLFGLTADAQMRLIVVTILGKDDPDYKLRMTITFNVSKVPNKERPRKLADHIRETINERFDGEKPWIGFGTGCEKTFNELVSYVAQKYYYWTNGDHIAKRRKVHEENMNPFLKKHPEIIDTCVEFYQAKLKYKNQVLNRKSAKLDQMATLALIGRSSNPEKTNEFFNALLKWEQERKDSINSLENIMISWDNSDEMPNTTNRFAILIKAYNSFIEEKWIRKLRYNKKAETFPLIVGYEYDENQKPVSIK